MRKYLLLLLFFVSVYAISSKDMGASKLNITVTWDVYPPAENLVLTSFAFPSTSFQKVDYQSLTPKKDSFGNELISFKTSSTNKLNAIVEVNYSNLNEPADSTNRYLQSTELTSFTPEMKTLAQSITQNSTSNLESLVLLTSWVHNNIDYSLGYGDETLSAEQTFKIREGTCDELAHLLIAFLHSKNIPARFVAGVVYSGESWGPHAWVEAAINGKWIPADPTFNEVKLLDASHVKFASGRDQNDIAEKLEAKSYDVSQTNIERKVSVKMMDVKPFPKDLFNMTIFLPEGTAGPGSLETISATLFSKTQLVVPVSLTAPKQLKVLGDADHLVLLEPRKITTVYWRVLTPSYLKKGYRYTFPLIFTSFSKNKTYNLTASASGSVKTGSKIVLENLNVLQKSNHTFVEFDLKNEGNVKIEPIRCVLSIANFSEERSLSLAPLRSRHLSFDVGSLNIGTFEGELRIFSKNVSISQPVTINISPKPKTSQLKIDTNLLIAVAGLLVALLLLFIILQRKHSPPYRS